jgi:hypothetical protein
MTTWRPHPGWATKPTPSTSGRFPAPKFLAQMAILDRRARTPSSAAASRAMTPANPRYIQMAIASVAQVDVHGKRRFGRYRARLARRRRKRFRNISGWPTTAPRLSRRRGAAVILHFGISSLQPCRLFLRRARRGQPTQVATPPRAAGPFRGVSRMAPLSGTAPQPAFLR